MPSTFSGGRSRTSRSSRRRPLESGVPDGRERLTPRVRRVLAIAEDEAVGLRQAEVGTEHVLLALLQISKILNESAPEAPGGGSPGLALLRGRERSPDRFADPDAHDPRDDV